MDVWLQCNRCLTHRLDIPFYVLCSVNPCCINERGKWFLFVSWHKITTPVTFIFLLKFRKVTDMVGLIAVYRHNAVRGHLEQKVHIKCYFRLRLRADLGSGLSSNWNETGQGLKWNLTENLVED